MSKRKTYSARYVLRLRADKEFLEGARDRLVKENAELSGDLAKFRAWAGAKMKWWLDLHGQGKSPSLPWLIEDTAKLFQRVKRFDW